MDTGQETSSASLTGSGVSQGFTGQQKPTASEVVPSTCLGLPYFGNSCRKTCAYHITP